MQKNKSQNQIYTYLFRKCKIGIQNEPQHEDSLSIYNHAAMLLHFLLKFIIQVHFQAYTFWESVVNSFVNAEVILVMIVVDFWVTKNVVGRSLLGVVWFFGVENNKQKLMYQARINKEYVHWGYRRLFWVVQATFLLFNYLDFCGLFSIQFSVYDVSPIQVFIAGSKIASAMFNLFMFYKAYKSADTKRDEMKDILGHEVVRKLGTGSFVSGF